MTKSPRCTKHRKHEEEAAEEDEKDEVEAEAYGGGFFVPEALGPILKKHGMKHV